MLRARGFALVAMLVSLALARPCVAGVAGLPAERPFAPLTADPAEVRLGFDWLEKAQLAAFTGRRVGVARFGEGPRAMVLAADGMLSARITSRPHFTFPLQTVDGTFGLALERARGAWSERLRWGHHSGHFGDGVPDVEARRFVYTRELVSFTVSYAASRALRLYAGPLATVRAAPRAAAWQGQLGGELRGHARAATAAVPYAAWHWTLKAENANRVNQSYEAGVRLNATSGSSARFMLGYFDGVSERGELWRTPERYVRLGVAVGE